MAIFISFEGDECVGKTTQASILTARLKASRIPAILVREPGGTPFGETCRSILKDPNNDLCPEAELLLMNASRSQLVSTVILPALNEGVTVIADRFHDSTIAYQGYGRELGQKAEDVVNVAIGDVIPDITFYLWAAKGTKERRQIQRGAPPTDKFESLDQAFFARVREGYEHIMTHNARVACIESSGAIDQVSDAIWSKLLSWKEWCVNRPKKPWEPSLSL